MKIAQTVDEYIAKHPPCTQEILVRVRSIVKECAPEANEQISYGMPAYKLNGVLVYFAACKNHLGLYPKADGLKAFSNELSGYKTSKGAIQFPYSKPMPYELIKRIVQYRVAQNKRVL